MSLETNTEMKHFCKEKKGVVVEIERRDSDSVHGRVLRFRCWNTNSIRSPGWHPTETFRNLEDGQLVTNHSDVSMMDSRSEALWSPSWGSKFKTCLGCM